MSQQPKKSISVRVRRSAYADIVTVADELLVPIATTIEVVVEGWKLLDEDGRRQALEAVRGRRRNGEMMRTVSVDNGGTYESDMGS